MAYQDVEKRLFKTAWRYSEKPDYQEPYRANAHGKHAHITQRHEQSWIFYNTNFCLPLSLLGLRVLLVLGPSRVTTDPALPYIIALVPYFFTFGYLNETVQTPFMAEDILVKTVE